MKKFALIVAGGLGLRMGEGIPKQFLLLKGRPVLFYTIEIFNGIADNIMLVLPFEHFQYWENLCQEYDFNSNVELVKGGETRSQSVSNGLNAISEEGIVAIHDAVRPLASKNLINNLYSATAKFGNAIPAIPLRESLRKINGNQNISVDRSEYIIIQTPQCFETKQIRAAYKNKTDRSFSDDAGLFEHFGGKVHLETGETSNIKITYKEDLLFAATLIEMADNKENDASDII